MYRITAVSTGNTCRSPLAEYLIRRALHAAGIDDVEVDSAATGDGEAGSGADPRAVSLLAAAGLDASGHTARRFAPERFADTDLVLALDIDHYTVLRRQATTPEDQAKVRMLRAFDPAFAGLGPADQGIYDPWFGDEDDFEACRQMISAALPGLVEHVRAETADARGA